MTYPALKAMRFIIGPNPAPRFKDWLTPTLLFVLCAVALYDINFGRQPQELDEVPTPHLKGPATERAPEAEPVEESDPSEAQRRVQTYFAHVYPILESAEEEQSRIIENALAVVQAHFARFHAGINPFTEDITSVSARWQVARRGVGDAWDGWWNENPDPDALGAFMRQKLAHHVISEERIQLAVAAALAQLADDLTALRNETLGEVRGAIAASDIPVNIDFDDTGWQQFKQSIVDDMAAASAEYGTDSVQSGILSLVAGEIVAEVAKRIILRVAAKQVAALAPALLSSVCAGAGGATVTAAVTGGGGGSLGGPLGTIAGLGAGVVVGIGIDWWMTAQFREKTGQELSAYLEDVEHGLLEGTKGNPGLRQHFTAGCRNFHHLMFHALTKHMLQENTP
jgi:hypothetical protein